MWPDHLTFEMLFYFCGLTILFASMKDFSTQLLHDLSGVLPELYLTGLVLVLVLLDLWASSRVTAWVAVVGLGLAVVWPWEGTVGFLFDSSLQVSAQVADYRRLFALAGLLGGLLAALPSAHGHTRQQTGGGEWYSLLAVLVLAANLLVLSASWLTLYLSLELLSLTSYILVAFRFDRRAAEGSLKYLLMGGLSSAVMLYGISWVYGLAGHLSFSGLDSLAEVSPVLAGVLLLMIFGALLFKLAAVPYHLWLPDVYASGPSAFLTASVLSKVAGAVALWQIWLHVPTSLRASALLLLGLAAVVSLFWGNLSALRQQSARRMLAFSGIAHAGLLLMAVLGGQAEVLWFYAVYYTIAHAGAFVLVAVQEEAVGHDQIEGFAGMGRAHPLLMLATVVLMAALAGLPVTAGFTAKLRVLLSIWESYTLSGHWILPILLFSAVANIVIGLFYYVRIPYIGIMRAGHTSTHYASWPVGLLVLLCLLLLWLFFVPV